MEVARREFSEMEALKASQELAFFKERLLKSEEDKQAAIAFVNDSWQVHVEQEKGKLQQLQTKNMDDMEAFYQNELKVQLDKQRVRLQNGGVLRQSEQGGGGQAPERAGEAAGGGVGSEGVQRVLEKLGERVEGKAAGPMGRLSVDCPF